MMYIMHPVQENKDEINAKQHWS